MNEKRAGELLGQLLKRYKLEAGLRRGRVLALWPEVAGKMLARLTEPIKLDRGELLVRVESAALAHQLTYQREEFLRRYASHLGEGVVKNIRFVSGRIRRQPRGSGSAPEDSPKPEQVTLPLELARKLEEWQKIVPADLRPAVFRAGRALLAAQAQTDASKVCPICQRPSQETPCRYCRTLLEEPLVRRAGRELEKNPLAEPLAGDLLAAARWLASEHLLRQIEDLAPQAVSDHRLLPLLKDRVQRFVALPVLGEEPAKRLERLPEAVRSLVKSV
ncbi:DciA family protein [Oceanithermus sp.]